MVDDARLQLLLGVSCLLLQAQKLEHIGVPHRVRRPLDNLALAGELAHACLVAAERQALVEGAVRLADQLGEAPIVLRCFDFVEMALVGVADAHEFQVV